MYLRSSYSTSSLKWTIDGESVQVSILVSLSFEIEPRGTIKPAPLLLCGNFLPWVKSAVHLGHELPESGLMDHDAVVTILNILLITIVLVLI